MASNLITSWAQTDFSDLNNCIKFLEHKGVKTKQLITFVGPTSTGKSALVNELVGAYVQESQDIPTTDRAALVIKANENEFLRMCGISLEALHNSVLRGSNLPLFPKENPELGPTDPRYGILYCRSATPSRHVREYGLPGSMDPEVTVVNGKYLDWATIKGPCEKGRYSEFKYTPMCTPVYLDTVGFSEGSVSSPTHKNHDKSWQGIRDWLGASAFKVLCLPCHTAPYHREFLQVFEDQMLKAQGKESPYTQAGGIVQDTGHMASEFFVGNTAKNRRNVNEDVWRDTVFALTQMDKNAGKGLRGLIDAVFEGGQPSSSLHNKLNANKVRYLSLPTQRKPIADGKVREFLDDEWKSFKALIEANTTVEGGDVNALVCKRASEYHSEVQDEKSYKSYVPHQFANDDAYYAREIGKRQNCSGDWWKKVASS